MPHPLFAARRILRAFVLVCALPAVQAAHADTTIAIANLGPHPALAQAVAGFKEQMASHGFIEGKNTKYLYSDANFTPALMPQMFSQLAGASPDLILTITTSVSQTALSAVSNRKIPLVFALVTDPVKAGLVPSWDKGSARSAGSSDLQDFDAVLAMGKRMFPHATSFSTLFNPGEVNDVVTTQLMQEAAVRAGLEFKAISVDAVGDIPQRAQLMRGTGFVYITGSNLVQSAIPAVAAAAKQLKVPVLSADTELVKTGLAAANHAVSLKSVGANAANIANQVLKGTATSQLAVVRPAPADYVTTISKKKFRELGLTVPASFDDCACFVE
jgi:putative ABC transport system substrate-binding protein